MIENLDEIIDIKAKSDSEDLIKQTSEQMCKKTKQYRIDVLERALLNICLELKKFGFCYSPSNCCNDPLIPCEVCMAEEFIFKAEEELLEGIK